MKEVKRSKDRPDIILLFLGVVGKFLQVCHSPLRVFFLAWCRIVGVEHRSEIPFISLLIRLHVCVPLVLRLASAVQCVAHKFADLLIHNVPSTLLIKDFWEGRRDILGVSIRHVERGCVHRFNIPSKCGFTTRTSESPMSML
jgi:hypothetical protein